MTESEPESKAAEAQGEPKRGGWFARLKQGLGRSADRLGGGIKTLMFGRKLDAEAWDAIEEALIMADLGPQAASTLVEKLKRRRLPEGTTERTVRESLAADMAEMLTPLAKPLALESEKRPTVVLMVGVNGSGKTTTIGKFAHQLRAEGKRVMIAACDTFRAAAVEQLRQWSERSGAAFFADEQGADAAAVAFDALAAAIKGSYDVLLIDTAGRLHNKDALMAELAKIGRVISKLEPSAPHRTLLVLDATTGQNAIAQVETFRALAKVTGLIVTKLDGSAKGGVLLALAEKCALPIHAIGVGEGIDDLQPFAARPFADALLGLDEAA
ncbi:MAG TPA: signal recognition particle-docking protein FtsY [Alphaproteobacteria bacterium]|nr:signal recognition particle-docking protein FtsY [Alphaproteobacteria bacterium]